MREPFEEDRELLEKFADMRHDILWYRAFSQYNSYDSDHVLIGMVKGNVFIMTASYCSCDSIDSLRADEVEGHGEIYNPKEYSTWMKNDEWWGGMPKKDIDYHVRMMLLRLSIPL